MKYNGPVRYDKSTTSYKGQKVLSFSLFCLSCFVEIFILTTTTFNIFRTFYIDNILFCLIQHLLADGVMRHTVVGGITLEVHPLKGKIKNFIKF